MNIPNNCAECAYTYACHAPHYGGDGCRHEKTIKNKTITEALKGGERYEQKNLY